jgi:uncharacterized repeat protein (TIGR03803 family)
MKRIAYVFYVLCTTAAISLPAQTFTTLHNFDGTDGQAPLAGLIQATDGNLYGTTNEGGTNGGYGTVFKITPRGTLSTLYSFCAQSNCADGTVPYAGLVQATNGDFYGTTASGGDVCCGGGTVFKITPSGNLTTLHSFCSQSECRDGETPNAGLVQASNGDLYGTTYGGGAAGRGTVFKITPSGTLTRLHSFCSQSRCMDGEYPLGGLVQGTDGDLYGTTWYGGTNLDGGTVFKITPGGALTTLHNFCSQDAPCTDGNGPVASLVQATDGDLYGTTEFSGVNGGGTIFKITPSGTLTTLYSFCAQSECADGEDPSYAGLIQATDGDLYGTTAEGGTSNVGTIFKITTSGTLTTLYSFCAESECADGSYPYAGLVQATNGIFYGTTYSGGANDTCPGQLPGCGTVFSLSVGLGPFVETQTTSGAVGAAVKILGTNLTGATSVTFNGAAAVFTVVQPSEITTTVPAGATTGTVRVVTPTGALSSNVPFRVP